MNETLRNTMQNDPGLVQFLKNYDRAVADEDLRKEYDSYVQGIFYMNGVVRSAFEDGSKEGIAKGIVQGIAKGEQKARIDTAKTYLKMGLKPPQVALGSGLPLDVVQKIYDEERATWQ